MPESLPESIRKRLRELQTKCHNWAFPSKIEDFPKSEDVHWSLEEAKELLRSIDENYGIQTIKKRI